MNGIAFQSITKRFTPELAAVDNVSLEVEEGEFLVLVGPSGCGKSTLLRMTAGLETVTSGEIEIGGQRVTNRRPKDRDIAMVFQNYALYPHMTVAENIGFGLSLRKVAKSERARRVERAAATLGLSDLLARKPAQLSGGQRQRVAIGRALVREPKAFLMDEPLSNLDANLRVQMRAELAQLRDRLRRTTLYVTHDQVEAMTLGNRVAVLRDGVLQQVDAPPALFANPVNLFVASFIGSPQMNFLRAHVTESGLEIAGAEVPAPRWADLTARRGAQVIVGIRPANVRIEHGESSSGLDARIEVVEELGNEAHVIATLAARAGAQLPDAAVSAPTLEGRPACTAVIAGTSGLGAGQHVRVVFDSDDAYLFDSATGTAIGPRTSGR